MWVNMGISRFPVLACIVFTCIVSPANCLFGFLRDFVFEDYAALLLGLRDGFGHLGIPWVQNDCRTLCLAATTIV